MPTSRQRRPFNSDGFETHRYFALRTIDYYLILFVMFT